MKNDKYISNLIGAFATSVTSGIDQQISGLGGRSLRHESALVVIDNHPNETIDVLSKVLSLTHSGTVKLINTLEEEGLVERYRSVQDARSVVLCVTPDGSKRVRQILQCRETVTAKLLEKFNDEQKQNLLNLLDVAMSGLTSEQLKARQICRLCDEGVCRKLGCPVEKSIIC